jgi:hypothetical protein
VLPLTSGLGEMRTVEHTKIYRKKKIFLSGKEKVVEVPHV